MVDEKQAGIKDSIKIISPLNASQKLLVSKVLRFSGVLSGVKREHWKEKG